MVYKGPKELFKFLMPSGYEPGQLQSMRNEMYWMVVLNVWKYEELSHKEIDQIWDTDEKIGIGRLIKIDIDTRHGKWRVE